MAAFVLVHGGCHGAWCYSRVAERLLTAGHAVYAPTLSGVGELAHLAGQAINLSTHIEDVVATIIDNDLTDVILCGHSYGGMVITGVAGRIGERIRTLFYIDGTVPDDGQSLFDLVGPERTLAMIDAAGETGILFPPIPAEAFQVNADDIDWVDRMCTPHPIACFSQKLKHTGKEAEVSQRTFVLCKRYHSINHATFAEVEDQPGWKAVSVDCGHDAMIDAPDEVTQLLLEELER